MAATNDFFNSQLIISITQCQRTVKKKDVLVFSKAQDLMSLNALLCPHAKDIIYHRNICLGLLEIRLDTFYAHRPV